MTAGKDLIFPLKVVKCAERLEVSGWLVCAKCEVKCLVCRLSSSGEPQLILEVMLACSGRVPGLITRSQPCALLDQAPVSLVDCKARAQPLEPGLLLPGQGETKINWALNPKICSIRSEKHIFLTLSKIGYESISILDN